MSKNTIVMSQNTLPAEELKLIKKYPQLYLGFLASCRRAEAERRELRQKDEWLLARPDLIEAAELWSRFWSDNHSTAPRSQECLEANRRVKKVVETYKEEYNRMWPSKQSGVKMLEAASSAIQRHAARARRAEPAV